jgi:hypothetical protein
VTLQKEEPESMVALRLAFIPVCLPNGLLPRRIYFLGRDSGGTSPLMR